VLRGRVLTYALSGAVVTTSGEVTLRLPAITVPSFPLGPFGPAASQSTEARTIETDLGAFDVCSVGAELFPTAKLGVRIGYSRWDGDSTADDAYDVEVGQPPRRLRRSLSVRSSATGKRSPRARPPDRSVRRRVNHEYCIHGTAHHVML